ncbi:MAG: phenylacetate-CoA oxygenase subunit PaaI, partial [Pseudomonadota bacterium]
ALPPVDAWMQSGGKQGRHTEHLGYLLAEMQFLQRAYPGAQW